MLKDLHCFQFEEAAELAEQIVAELLLLELQENS